MLEAFEIVFDFATFRVRKATFRSVGSIEGCDVVAAVFVDETKDLSLASFDCLPEVLAFFIVIGVPRGWFKTCYICLSYDG